MKSPRYAKWFRSILRSPMTAGILIALAATNVAFRYYARIDEPVLRDDRSLRGLIHQIHEKTVDWRMINRGVALGSDRIAILAIDDESIRLEGRWPWPRDKTARLIDRAIYSYGAHMIAFDMNFSEPDNSSSLPTLTRINEQTKNSPDGHVKELLRQELGKSDVDAVLATSIDGSSDHLILGSFSSEVAGGDFLPFQDICTQAHFQRSYAGRYWATELVKSTVVDSSFGALSYPRAAVEANLNEHFATLETIQASAVFDTLPNINERLTKVFKESGFRLEPSIYPYLMVDHINNDYHSAQSHLDQTNHAELKSNDTVKTLFADFDLALSDKETATLRSTVFSAGLDYCHRFFTADDELRSLEVFKKLNPSLAPEASRQVYAANAWEHVWPPKENSEAAIDRLKKAVMPTLIPESLRWEVNIPSIDKIKSHSGYFDAVLDNDGTIRNNALLKRDGLSYLESIAFKTFLVDQKLAARATIDIEHVANRSSKARVFTSLEARDRDGHPVIQIPIDKQGLMQVNYSGPSFMFPHVSATDVLADTPGVQVTDRAINPRTGHWEVRTRNLNKAEFLKNKILILGATALGIYDLRVTPFEENFPGVETHANALSNLLVETARAKGEKTSGAAPGFLRHSPWEDKTMWVFLLVGGLALSALLNHFGSIAGLGITTLFLAAIFYVDNYILFKSGTVITSFFPVALVVVEFVGLTSFKYFIEERKKRELKGTFEKYVSPSIVAEVLADPENIELGGKKMDLTVMFSDVRGFTTISEKLDPRALSNLLNSYLTPMTNLVFANKGTLDKYMGDAIMAFWGAPVHFDDHAKHAARCALQMLVKLRELQTQYRAEGLPEIDIGIGLNTGDMSVGNMGSNTVRSYTVMGDAVNLGSRLEGINKQYGTRIIVSEFTYTAIGSEFICREVDWVRVKGKAQPIRIFELVAEGNVGEEKRKVLRFFAEGFTFYHAQKFAQAREQFAQALSLDANDAPSQLYLERCADYLREPPPHGWDGVFTMTSK